MATKEQLKELPGWSKGVRDNAAIRMVKMVQPICPYSQKEYDTTPEGKLVERRNAGAQPNCQAMGGAWWEYCESQGHDPYNRTRVWYSKSDLWEEIDGEQVKTGERTIRHEDKIPNIVQVAAHMRVNSGRGPQFKHDNHGFRFLPEMGFAEVCEMRNCQKPVKWESAYGKYCSKLHAALCGADGAQMNLEQIEERFIQGKEIAFRTFRQQQLEQAANIIRAMPVK